MLRIHDARGCLGRRDFVRIGSLGLGGLTLADPVNQFEDGHSPEIATLLTAAPLNRDRLECGVSCDQYAAQRLARFTFVTDMLKDHIFKAVTPENA